MSRLLVRASAACVACLALAWPNEPDHFAWAADKPRETPLSPADELATFQLADPRLTVELVAAEPELDSPVAVCWDADGRMFVAEMIDYPLGPTSGRIRMLEDRDGDARYEHATIFADGLRFPNGVFASRGGLLVTAAPDILFLKDTNGDGRADEKHVVFSGFGEGNQQLRANGLTWGLDNWIYGANGRSDGAIRRPAAPTEPAISIRGRDFRFLPDGSRFEPTTGASQFGQAADDWGNRFLSWNTIPIRHAVFDQAFVERNPHLADFAVRDIADPGDTGQVFPISARPTTFNRERTDYYNALAGLTIYRGDALGSEYAGNAFVGESLTNLVHHRRLTPEGASFVSRRGEHGREFLASRDPWFHPVFMTTGPDGALYVVDFYRRWVEHPAFVAESLRAGVDWRQGHGHGRIWKVSRRENTWPPRPAPNLSRLAGTELARRLSSPNGWMRDSAHRLLVERADPQPGPVLRATIADNRFATAKPHALAVLQALGLLDDGTLLRALEDGEPRVRQVALRMVAPRLPHSQTLAQSVLNMSDFPHPVVRFELPGALRLLDTPAKTNALVKLADLEAADPLISLAIVGNLGGAAEGFLPRLLAHDAAWRKNPSTAQMSFLSRVASGMCSASDERMLTACLHALGTSGAKIAPGELAILHGIDQGLATRGQSLRAMLAKPDASLAAYSSKIRALTLGAERAAADRKQPLEHRLLAIHVAVRFGQRGGDFVRALLVADEAQAVQLAAADASSQLDKSALAEIFGQWQDLTTLVRRAVLNSAVRSRAGADALVSAVEAEQIALGELEPAVRFALREQRDAELKRRIDSILLPAHEEANRAQVVARYEPLAGRAGDRTRGAALFEKHCIACHMIQGRGQRVGPDLSGVGSRPKQSLLVDIFDPSRELAPNFAAYTLVTRSGQVLSGLMASETAAAVTLRRAEGAQDVVPRAQIEELRATGKSLMPEGLESVLSEDNVVDLLEFLAQPDARLLSGT